jgi:PXPV repeat (3 copies)
MKRISSGILAVLTGMALMSAAPAMARVDVDINVGVPGAFIAPAPYGPPPRYLGPPAYLQPGPVYVQPGPVYVQPGPVYVQPRPVYRDEWREREWREREWRHRHEGRHWDRDGDGVPNRYDHRPNNPYRY